MFTWLVSRPTRQSGRGRLTRNYRASRKATSSAMKMQVAIAIQPMRAGASEHRRPLAWRYWLEQNCWNGALFPCVSRAIYNWWSSALMPCLIPSIRQLAGDAFASGELEVQQAGAAVDLDEVQVVM